MKLFVSHLLLKPAYQDPSTWDSSVQETFNLHSEFVNRAVRHGRVMLVGQTETVPQDNFGMLVFEAENQAEADEILNSDPAIARGIMVGKAFPFKLLKVTDQAKKWSVL